MRSTTPVRAVRARRSAEAAPRSRPTKMRKTDGETRAGQIRAALGRDIVSGRLQPGAKINEEEFSAHYGVSRTPVREALQHLASEGLVELRPHQGAFVAKLTVGSLMEMFELMALLEADCAALASRRCTADDHVALTAAHDACKRAVKRNDPELFYRANTALHECIYRAAHNSLLESQTIALRDRLELYRRETTFHPGLMALSITEHEKILQAIFSMDESAARANMHGHLDTLRNDAIAMLENPRNGVVRARSTNGRKTGT